MKTYIARGSWFVCLWSPKLLITLCADLVGISLGVVLKLYI